MDTDTQTLSTFSIQKTKGLNRLQKNDDGSVTLYSKRFDPLTGEELEENAMELKIDSLTLEKQKLQSRIVEIDNVLNDIEKLK